MKQHNCLSHCFSLTSCLYACSHAPTPSASDSDTTHLNCFVSCHGSCGQSSVCHRVGLGSVSGQWSWDLCWTKWNWMRFSWSTLNFSRCHHSTNASCPFVYLLLTLYHRRNSQCRYWTRLRKTSVKYFLFIFIPLWCNFFLYQKRLTFWHKLVVLKCATPTFFKVMGEQSIQ